LHLLPADLKSQGGLMKTRIVFATVTALALTVALAAQAPPSSTPASAPQTAAVQTVIVTGCLKPIQPSATTAGTAGTTSMQPKFMITNLVTTPAATGATTAGTATASKATITEYRLDFDEAKLTPHVGHKIEISGTPVVVTTTPALPATVGTLKVTNVKMVASACP
jgi:hypothetical protein